MLELCSCQQVLILYKMWLDWPKLRTSNHRTSAVGPLQKKKSKVKSSLLTSLIANIIIGAITGTLILDSTRSALPRISWLGSWERRQQILNLTSCIQRVTIYLFLIHNNIQCNLEQGSSSLSEVTKRLTYFRHPFINHNGIDQSSLI